MLGLRLENVTKLVLHDLMIKEDELAYKHKFTRHSIICKFIGSRNIDLNCLKHLDISKNRLTLLQITELLNNLADGSTATNITVLKV